MRDRMLKGARLQWGAKGTDSFYTFFWYVDVRHRDHSVWFIIFVVGLR